MNLYREAFKKMLKEMGSNYVPTTPNTAGSGGALGNAASIGAPGTASGTPGTDTYATGDFRTPVSIFGGIITRRGKRKSRALANKSKNRRK